MKYTLDYIEYGGEGPSLRICCEADSVEAALEILWEVGNHQISQAGINMVDRMVNLKVSFLSWLKPESTVRSMSVGDFALIREPIEELCLYEVDVVGFRKTSAANPPIPTLMHVGRMIELAKGGEGGTEIGDG